MTMSLLEAFDLVDARKAAEYIGRFVERAVKRLDGDDKVSDGDLDGAMVAAALIVRLSETADGRNLLGLPKRKNTKYKAKDFGPDAQQRLISIEYKRGKIERKEAVDALACSLDPCPDLRTAGHLLDELVADQTSVDRFIVHLIKQDLANQMKLSGSQDFTLACFNAFQRMHGGENLYQRFVDLKEQRDKQERND